MPRRHEGTASASPADRAVADGDPTGTRAGRAAQGESPVLPAAARLREASPPRGSHLAEWGVRQADTRVDGSGHP